MYIVAVAGLIRNSKDEVLLVRHPRRGWEMPGGEVDEGEDLAHALKREVKEEAGVEIEVVSLAGIYSKIRSPSLLILGFLCDYVEGELKPSDESPEVSWVPEETALDRVSHPAIHDRVRDLLDFRGRIRYRVYSTNPYVIHEEYQL